MSIDVTPLTRLYSRFRYHRLDGHDIPAVQQHQLFWLLQKARDTRFGRQHRFANISSIEDFQQAVPLRDYDALWEGFWEESYPNLVDCTWPSKIPYFGISNGTTAGRTKYIPLSWEMVKSYKRASFDLFCHHLQQNPDSSLLSGKGAHAGSLSPLQELAPDVYASVVPSILLSKAMPPWVKPWYLTDLNALRRLPADTDKMPHLARLLLAQDIRSISGMPTALLSLFEALQEISPRPGPFRLKEYFPRLEMLVQGGTSPMPYRSQFQAALMDSNIDLREIYPTTEGFIAIADRGVGEGLRLIYDHGIFYEFIPLDALDQAYPRARWLGDVEVWKDYSIVVSSCAGLWRYPLGDVVRFECLKPPRLRITGRTAQTITITGNLLMEFDFNQVLTTAAQICDAVIAEFVVGATIPRHLGDKAYYRYLIEFHRPPESAERFLEVMEDTLRQHDALYRATWINGERGITMPELHIAPPGAFRAWLRQQGKAVGEGKIPRILPDTERFEALLAFIQNWNL